ncbi:Rho termination factor domain-containing protein [Synechococcus sp. KORDI-49]|nr:Rho termination factor domain-containing protein [Synechococcus sp. KORDI-49]
MDVSQTLTSLARLTLRQLRQIASDLGVPLYSRKSKEALVGEVAQRQEQRGGDLKAIEAELSAPAISTSETRVVFLPRDPQWAYVFWEISDDDRQRAQKEGASRLCLRLADVTGMQDGSAHPHTLQEVPVDSHSTEWYLPVPLCDRDYRVELGYRIGTTWMSLAFSSVARVPALHPSEQILDQFVPFSLDTTSVPEAPAAPVTPAEPSDSGLHERLYQSATVHFRRRRVGSEEFQEGVDSSGDSDSFGLSDSGIGLWASGRNESGLGGVAPRQRSFWLVADAELIVYGATDPSARLTIGGEDVPLSTDGTFRIQVPFRDGEQMYPIEATAADGEQKRNITLNFARQTPEDNSNPASEARAEWF